MISDGELMAAWQGGDAAAGSVLFERHFESVYRFFCNKAGEEIDDLVQQTFLGCLEAAKRFRSDASFRTFLFAVARNKLYDHLRARQRSEHRGDVGLTSLHDLGISPGDLIAQHEEQRLLLRALRRLPLDLQVALELSYWEGLTDVALAEVLGIPTGTLKSRLRKARQLLHRELAAIASTPEQLRSTAGDLETWIASVREAMKPPK